MRKMNSFAMLLFFVIAAVGFALAYAWYAQCGLVNGAIAVGIVTLAAASTVASAIKVADS